MVTGESHYVFGTRYRLRVIADETKRGVIVKNRSRLDVHVPPNSGRVQREKILRKWYRQRLRELIPPLLAKWQSIFDVGVCDWRIRRMKTKWGACNVGARRISINLELAKKPTQCLEYVIAHELTHFLERKHNDRFVAILDRHVPHWRAHRSELNLAPLAHENWKLMTEALTRSRLSKHEHTPTIHSYDQNRMS